MLEALNPYAWLIKLAAIALLVGAAWWAWTSHISHQQQIGYDRATATLQPQLDHARGELAAEKSARAQEQAWAQQLETANREAEARNQALEAAAAAAAATAGRLRNNLADLQQRLAGTTAQACRETAATLATLFGNCTDEYRALAATADGHASDVRTLSDAWPGRAGQ